MSLIRSRLKPGDAAPRSGPIVLTTVRARFELVEIGVCNQVISQQGA